MTIDTKPFESGLSQRIHETIPTVADHADESEYIQSPIDARLNKRIERLSQKIGRKIFKQMAKHEPPAWKPAGLENIAMSLMMKDEDLRYRMLRFVDVYPALKDAKTLSKTLEEYLHSPALATGDKPGKLSMIARSIGKDRPLARKPMQVASKFGISRMGSQFIAGHTPEEVAPRIRKMVEDGFEFSLDLLGEFVVSDVQADDFLRRYREMVERFGKLVNAKSQNKNTGPLVNISIKLSSLTSKFEPADPEGTSEAVRNRLRGLFRAAKSNGVFINVDMEKYEYRDLTLQIILDLLDEEEFRGFKNIGTVHQAYLKDAHETLLWFLDELRQRDQEMTIRLVKGAYWDSEQIWARQRGWPVPVITNKQDTDAMYERCTSTLLQNSDLVRTAIASHNVRSIAYALACVQAMKIDRSRFELQMLYGMAGSIKDALHGMNWPVRIYTPCGELIPGMAYLVRRILENTSNESFLVQRFGAGVSAAMLLADPKAPSLKLSPKK